MDDYDKMAIVGRGAFGTVYLCRRTTGERLIMKQIAIEHLNEKELENTAQEVKVMSHLDHPHIIKYFDSFVDNGSLMIIMEFATKGTLHEFLQVQKDLLSQQKMLYFFCQLSLALKYIHDKRILHRDITTRNILLTGSHGHIIKLTDFGISKVLTSRSKTSSVVGTPSYLSPELCEGKMYGTHSDVWAMGCVLYNMCTLREAFQAPTLAALVMKIMHGAIEPVSPSYDPGIMELLQMMLNRDFLKRPSVTSVLAHRLLAPVVCHIVTSLGGIRKPDYKLMGDEFKI